MALALLINMWRIRSNVLGSKSPHIKEKWKNKVASAQFQLIILVQVQICSAFLWQWRILHFRTAGICHIKCFNLPIVLQCILADLPGFLPSMIVQTFGGWSFGPFRKRIWLQNFSRHSWLSLWVRAHLYLNFSSILVRKALTAIINFRIFFLKNNYLFLLLHFIIILMVAYIPSVWGIYSNQ